MEVTISPGRLRGTIRMIESKSHVHRLLIAAALGKSNIHIGCIESSADIDATVRCLNALGADIMKTETEYHVNPITLSDTLSFLDCGESGSTLRFLLPVIGSLGKNAEIKLFGRLSERPLSPLWEELIAHGMCLSKPQSDIIRCSGQLSPGTYTIPGNISSQFISGLLFALPFLQGDSVINVTGKLESKSYINMTLDALSSFGIQIKTEGQKFFISGNQCARSSDIVAEGDWSNAAFWLSAGALNTRVSCTGLNPFSLQGDRAIVDLLKQFGAIVDIKNSTVSAENAPLTGITIDAEQIPDLVPILAVCATAAIGKTEIIHAERLRIKESDRLATVSTMLHALGADIHETKDGLTINGGRPLIGGVTVSSCNDHRIAMSAAIAATVCEKPVTITNAQAVNKSYPKFWEHFEDLGGIITRREYDE